MSEISYESESVDSDECERFLERLSSIDQVWVEVGGTKMRTNFKCDF